MEIESTINKRFAIAVSNILSNPKIAGPTASLRRAVRGATPGIKLMLGRKDGPAFADGIKALLADNPQPINVYVALSLDKIPEESIYEAIAYIREQIDYIENGLREKSAV